MISFFPIKKTDLVILDDNYSGLKFKKINYASVKLNKINVFCLILSVKNYFFNNQKKMNLKKIYKQTMLRMYKPAIAITHHLSTQAQDCKNLCPEIKVIVYQYSFFYIKTLKKLKVNCDFFFLNHQKDKSYLIKNNIIEKEKLLISGSIKNNERQGFTKKKSLDILYISQFTTDTTSKNHMEGEKYIIKLIDDFCIKNKYKFNIALKYCRKDKKKYSKSKLKEEIRYIRGLIKSEIKFSSSDSLKLACESKIIITLSSNFAMELISRRHKVLFLPFDDSPGNTINYYLPKKNLINVQRNKNKNKIFKKIKLLLNIDNKSWMKYLNKNEYFKFRFDKDNRFFKKFIINLLKKENQLLKARS